MKVGGSLILEEAKFSRLVTFIRAQIADYFEARGAEFRNMDGPALFSSMKVDGEVFFGGALFSRGADMSDGRYFDLTIGGIEIPRSNRRQYPEPNLSRTVIARELRIENAEIGRMIATDLQVSGSAWFTNLKIVDQLDLTRSTFVNVSFSDVWWPLKGHGNSVRLTGMKYQQISARHTETKQRGPQGGRLEQVWGRLTFAGKKGLAHESDSWEGLLELTDRADYDASTYSTLEAFFRSQGAFDRADKVFFANKHRALEKSSGGIWERAFSYFMHYSVGYGRKPELALFWCGIVLSIGCLVFRAKGMEPRKPESTHYYSLWYSLDVFIPVIQFQIAGDWVPKYERWCARQYVYVHRLLGAILVGWLLIPIGVEAVKGIIK